MLLVVSALAAACDSGGLGRVPDGPWGGEHVGLVVRAIGATVSLDCAHGEITVPLRLDSDGRFSLPGYYVRDVGPALEPENRRPATYFGSFDGHQLTLSVTLIEDSFTDGPFVALPGGQANVQRCRESGAGRDRRELSPYFAAARGAIWSSTGATPRMCSSAMRLSRATTSGFSLAMS